MYTCGSLRVMGTALATGHATGVAAALHAAAGNPGLPAKRSKNCKTRTPSCLDLEEPALDQMGRAVLPCRLMSERVKSRIGAACAVLSFAVTFLGFGFTAA
jgi:hypothetical protein